MTSRTLKVACPICRESGMGCTMDSQGWMLVHCANASCRSNRPVDATPPVKDMAASVEPLGGTTGLERTTQGREVLAQLQSIFDPETQQPAVWNAIKTAMFTADLRETRGSRKWCEVFAGALREADAGQGSSQPSAHAVARADFVVDAKPFALVLDRFVDDEVDLAVLQENGFYLFSDGDLHRAEGNMLGMWEAEFLTQHELEKRFARLAVGSKDQTSASVENDKQTMHLSHAPFQGLDAGLLRQLVDAAIQERENVTNLREAFSENDWKIAEMLWPGLDDLAKLFEFEMRSEEDYVAPRWQVDVVDENVFIQSHSGDRFDEGMTLTGNFASREERVEVANGIARCLNKRKTLALQTTRLKAKIQQAENEITRLRASLALASSKG